MKAKAHKLEKQKQPQIKSNKLEKKKTAIDQMPPAVRPCPSVFPADEAFLI